MIRENVKRFRDITECLKRERKESATPISTVAISACQPRETNDVSLPLAKAIRIGERARRHLTQDKKSVFGRKDLVRRLNQGKQLLGRNNLRMNNMIICRLVDI